MQDINYYSVALDAKSSKYIKNINLSALETKSFPRIFLKNSIYLHFDN